MKRQILLFFVTFVVSMLIILILVFNRDINIVLFINVGISGLISTILYFFVTKSIKNKKRNNK